MVLPPLAFMFFLRNLFYTSKSERERFNVHVKSSPSADTFKSTVRLKNVSDSGTSTVYAGGGKRQGGSNGSPIQLFESAPIRLLPESIPWSSYAFGAINTDRNIYNDFKENGAKSQYYSHLKHEFGHYLQEKIGGKLWYYTYVKIASPFNMFTNTYAAYNNSWTEVQANTLSYYYFRCPKNWDSKSYPINSDYISPEIKQQLLKHEIK